MLRYPLATIVWVLLAPAVAHAGFLSNANGPSITVNGAGIADDRYPATLKIEGGDGPITKVRPFITDVAHSDPDALDLALVSPTGNGVVLMSDACGGTAFPSPRTFVFDQTLASPLADEGPCSSGAFLPSNFSPADSWPAPGPGSLTNASLNTLIGRNPNGDWKLFAFNDVGALSGQISGWGLEITTATATVVIPAVGATSGVANEYPLTKTLDTPDDEVIDDLNLKLTGFNHQHPGDVDMLIQGPKGEAVMAMSDACGDTDINTNFSWTFDDEAPRQFGEDFTNCTDTSIRPVDHGTPLETLPGPAPARPYASAMSAFDGLGGGTFRLFINDDGNGDTGYIGAWDLIATTRPAATTGFTAGAVATAEGQTATLTVTRSGPVNLGPATLKVDIGHSGTDPSDLGSGVPTPASVCPRRDLEDDRDPGQRGPRRRGSRGLRRLDLRSGRRCAPHRRDLVRRRHDRAVTTRQPFHRRRGREAAQWARKGDRDDPEPGHDRGR